jgi:predicted  nucleic acid-binding Zn-ribbon protein
MSEDDLKAVLAKYQQKSFELFNQNIVLETQVEQLSKTVSSLQEEIKKLSPKPKRASTKEEDFQ